MPLSRVRALPAPVSIHSDPQASNMNQQSASKFLNTIGDVEKRLSALSDPVINESQLSSLGFTRAAALPYDEGPVLNDNNLFFNPYPDDKTEDLYTGLIQSVVEGAAQYLDYCDKKHHSMSCPQFVYHRIHSMLSWAKYPRLAGWRSTTSICAKDSQHQKASINTLYDGASDHPAVYGSRRTEDGPWWWMKQAAFISGKPHVRCIVADTTIAKGDEVLRSELVCALKLMYHQMKCSRYAGSVVPVLVFSIGHTDVGRVTQVHFDWSSGAFVLRQMRLMNFVPASGDQNIRTIYDWAELGCFFRWLEATPTGETQMVKQVQRGV